MTTSFPLQQVSPPNQTSSSPKVCLLKTFLIKTVGWPSGGGSISGSVAGISELQTFINTFPGAAKDANINYYWFEGYDEPWKVVFDTATAAYEDKWVPSLEMELIIGIIGCKWFFEEWNYIAVFCWVKSGKNFVG